MSFNSDSLTHLGFDKQYVQHTPAAIDRNYIPVSAYDDERAVVIASRRGQWVIQLKMPRIANEPLYMCMVY